MRKEGEGTVDRKRTVVVVLSMPPRELSPNARPRHWAVKPKATKRYRETACLIALAAKPRGHVPWTRATATIIAYVPDARRRDRDNLLASLKAAFDGIVDAGILTDDRGLAQQPPVFLVSRKPRIEITLRRLPCPA